MCQRNVPSHDRNDVLLSSNTLDKCHCNIFRTFQRPQEVARADWWNLQIFRRAICRRNFVDAKKLQNKAADNMYRDVSPRAL